VKGLVELEGLLLELRDLLERGIRLAGVVRRVDGQNPALGLVRRMGSRRREDGRGDEPGGQNR